MRDMAAPEHAQVDAMAVIQAFRYTIFNLVEKEYVQPDGTQVPDMLVCAVLKQDCRPCEPIATLGPYSLPITG